MPKTTKKITTIPATLTRFTATPITEQKKRRVAGYARVSTDHDDQFTSYEAQIDYYTNYIKSRDDWEFVDVYTDAGITGTSTKHREGFKRMVADALDGKIDLIVTKSVSRFARNTVDSLTTIRQLKENGIECYFEKENIWTFDGKGELLLTIMSSLAQEESRSISENCTWGQRKRFADGKVTVPFNRFLGYDRGPDGNLVVNREQAAIVQRIYAMFLQGMTYNGIAQQLTDDGILSPGGKPKWNTSAVKSILSNEKYKGCALLQKTYTVDYLTKKKKVNEGEIPQYYVEDNHEAIIDPDTFEMVQREMEKRGKGRKYHSGVHTFSSKIRCGECGSWYGSKVYFVVARISINHILRKLNPSLNPVLTNMTHVIVPLMYLIIVTCKKLEFIKKFLKVCSCSTNINIGRSSLVIRLSVPMNRPPFFIENLIDVVIKLFS